MATFDIGWVDIACLVLLVISVAAGFVRGLVFEVLSLAGWVVAYIAAQAFASEVSPYMPFGDSMAPKGSAFNHGLAFACTFVVVLIAWSLATRLVSLLVRATPLSIVDRFLGAGFGAVRALVLLLVVATVLSMTPSLRWPAWRASHAAEWSEEWLRSLKPMMPDASGKKFEA